MPPVQGQNQQQQQPSYYTYDERTGKKIPVYGTGTKQQWDRMLSPTGNEYVSPRANWFGGHLSNMGVPAQLTGITGMIGGPKPMDKTLGLEQAYKTAAKIKGLNELQTDEFLKQARAKGLSHDQIPQFAEQFRADVRVGNIRVEGARKEADKQQKEKWEGEKQAADYQHKNTVDLLNRTTAASQAAARTQGEQQRLNIPIQGAEDRKNTQLAGGLQIENTKVAGNLQIQNTKVAGDYRIKEANVTGRWNYDQADLTTGRQLTAALEEQKTARIRDQLQAQVNTLGHTMSGLRSART